MLYIAWKVLVIDITRSQTTVQYLTLTACNGHIVLRHVSALYICSITLIAHMIVRRNRNVLSRVSRHETPKRNSIRELI